MPPRERMGSACPCVYEYMGSMHASVCVCEHVGSLCASTCRYVSMWTLCALCVSTCAHARAYARVYAYVCAHGQPSLVLTQSQRMGRLQEGRASPSACQEEGFSCSSWGNQGGQMPIYPGCD